MADMGKKTVRRRIFRSNAVMILVTIVVFLAINIVIVGGCMEAAEQRVKAAIEDKFEQKDVEELYGQWKQIRTPFLILFWVDVVLCISAFIWISHIFTKNLAKHIMEPLEVLKDGAQRVQDNELRQEIVYTGDVEFENVCDTFNDMQRHIREEQEKNHRYEKARTDMIAGISHDLRTPLTAIRGTIKGLLDGVAASPGQQNRFLEAAYRRTGEMNVLLNQLFYLSKLETGNMPMQLQRVEMAGFVKSYVESRREMPENEIIQIQEDAGTETICAQIDPEQMQRILDNLMENSRKYAEVEKLKIRLELYRKRDTFFLRFRDNGVGVLREKLPHIFEEFYRGDESRNEKEGNGLGLYIVKYLVEAMGGTVRAENENGLVVTMELPMEREG